MQTMQTNTTMRTDGTMRSEGAPGDAALVAERTTRSGRFDARHDGLGVLGGIGIGAALMYFLDHDRGARRRSVVADKLVHTRHIAADAFGTTARDVANRARGAAAVVRARVRPDDADDRVVEERVRAELGRVVSHPSAIVATASQGLVTLSGPVLASEVEHLVTRVRRVRGVSDVENRLQAHESAEGVPGLQGGVERDGGEFELRQSNWTPAARLLTTVAGGALALYGARQRGAAGAALGLAGVALFSRGASNSELARLAGLRGRDAVNIQKAIAVNAPIEDVFDRFTQWENWPHWMSHVREIRRSGPRGVVGERTHWVVDGPAGRAIEWDAETTRILPNELVSWKSVEGASIRHEGTVRFDRIPDGATRVQVQMSYAPPAGALGHAVATILGRDPKRQMDDDLARFKTTIETGRPPRDAASRLSEASR
jgi:uncharacterized membrane protein/osmotically-inducible protein OsmY